MENFADKKSKSAEYFLFRSARKKMKDFPQFCETGSKEAKTRRESSFLGSCGTSFAPLRLSERKKGRMISLYVPFPATGYI
jgi:hypothetical protein